MIYKKSQTGPGFTIVELLVVIVVIGILAAITIVSYTGISAKANIAAISSDLANAKKQFAMYYTEHGVYPTSLNGNKCLTNTTLTPITDTNYCLKPSSGNDITITGATNTAYTLTSVKGDLTYKVTNLQSPTASVDGTDWLVIGAQTWAKKNLDVGTRIDGTVTQTDNSSIEKYCYGDNPANCTANNNGGLYQWDEAMQYSTTEGAQGICPANSHIPSDNDWKILEMQLGMTQAQADANSWRGTDQGMQLKSGGTSGLNMPLLGYRETAGSFIGQTLYSNSWSSSDFNASTAGGRTLYSGRDTAGRSTYSKSYGFSVRCLGN